MYIDTYSISEIGKSEKPQPKPEKDKRLVIKLAGKAWEVLLQLNLLCQQKGNISVKDV